MKKIVWDDPYSNHPDDAFINARKSLDWDEVVDEMNARYDQLKMYYLLDMSDEDKVKDFCDINYAWVEDDEN
jgi:hypothetical protein